MDASLLASKGIRPGDSTAVCCNQPAAMLAGTNPEYADALLKLATRLALPESYLGHIRKAGQAPRR